MLVVHFQVLYVGNGGVLNGVGADDIESVFCSISASCQVYSPEGKPYCFVMFADENSAEKVYEKCQGMWLSVKDRKIQLFLSFIEKGRCLSTCIYHTGSVSMYCMQGSGLQEIRLDLA